MDPTTTVKLPPGKRVLFLTKHAALIRRQLAGELDLTMDDVTVDDLLDDINTDVMTPAWVCFNHKPQDIARDAYAGLIVGGERIFERDALKNGNFEVIVSGLRKGVGSSRETAVHAEEYSGIRVAIAASFAPIHARNNINRGVLMGDHDMLRRLQAGEEISVEDFCEHYDPLTRLIVNKGGLFPFAKALASGDIDLPRQRTAKRPMNMAEKILARHLVHGEPGADAEEPVEADGKTDPDIWLPSLFVKPGDAILVEVDGGYSHDFTSAQVHYLLQQEHGNDYVIRRADRFAAFEDHLVYAGQVAELAPLMGNVQSMRDLQREFQDHSHVTDYLTQNGDSPFCVR